MNDQLENNAPGFSWHKVFEGGATFVLIGILGGVFATYMTVSQMSQTVNAMSHRLDKLETKTDDRIRSIESDVRDIQIIQARYHSDD